MGEIDTDGTLESKRYRALELCRKCGYRPDECECEGDDLDD